MPEGDSIHSLAKRLTPLLVGRAVTAFRADDIADAEAASLVGCTIAGVEARGKNLLVVFEDGRALHLHLRMHGRLGVERPRSRFWKPRRTAPQLRLAVEGAAIVGDRIPVVRLLRAGALARAPGLATLGPDLLAPEVAFDDALSRLRSLGEREIGDALLQQRAVAGIGNIYKSETLFLERIDPRARVATLDDATLRRILSRASSLLRRNVGPGRRVTRESLAGPRFWVYRRNGRPCLRCETPIARILQGASPGRSTYYCPRCQAVVAPDVQRTQARSGERDAHRRMD